MIKLNRNGYREFLKGKLSFRKEFIKEYSKEGFDGVYFENEFLGYGYLDFEDDFPLRIYSLEIEDFEDAIKENIRKAYKIREKIGYSDVGRIVFSDSDFLPGLIFDKYKDVGVISISSELFNKNREFIYSILEDYVDNLYERSKKYNRFQRIFGDKFETEFREMDVNFYVNVERGQKTGFYLDQRDNRLKFRKWVGSGYKVLDAFCYSGGFGIHALKKGNEVSFLDKSEVAIEMLKRNLELNDLEGKIHQEDFFDFAKKGEKFDIILADPPSYSEITSESKAYKNYYLIAYYSLKMTGNYFIYSICDPKVDVYNMIALVQKAARRLGIKIDIFDVTFQSKDHRISHPSFLYLKTLWVEIL